MVSSCNLSLSHSLTYTTTAISPLSSLSLCKKSPQSQHHWLHLLFICLSLSLSLSFSATKLWRQYCRKTLKEKCFQIGAEQVSVTSNINTKRVRVGQLIEELAAVSTRSSIDSKANYSLLTTATCVMPRHVKLQPKKAIKMKKKKGHTQWTAAPTKIALRESTG